MVTALLTTVILSVTFLVGFAGPSSASSYPYSVDQSKSGLVVGDPLDGNYSQSQLSSQSSWKFGGDAAGENAPYAYYENSQGLHIGVQAPANGTYAGYYAEVQRVGMLAHAVLTAPSTTIPYGYYNVGLYLQTGGPDVDYIFCGAQTSRAGTFWGVSSATGSTGGASSYQSLYYDASSGQPLTRSCTIVTNGENYLVVYIDNHLVYSSSSLGLGYDEPFYFFLETESSNNGQLLYGSFRDFYATASGNVTLAGNPSNAASVKLLDSSGNTIASAPVSSGSATLDIASYDFPLSGTLNVYDSSGATITSAPVAAYGGDVYQVSASTTTTTTSSSITSSASQSQSSSTSSSSSSETVSSTSSSTVTSSTSLTSSSSSSTTTSTSSSSTSPDPTQTSVSCQLGVRLRGLMTCTATVADVSGSPTPPTGVVAFTSLIGGNSAGASSLGTCTLSGDSASTSCFVDFTPVVIGSFTVMTYYGGDGSHLPSSGSQIVSCPSLACL